MLNYVTKFHISAEIEFARPQTVGEEELQLQLALAMSREEAEQEEQKRRSDDVRLQLALTQSEKEMKLVRSTRFNCRFVNTVLTTVLVHVT